MSRPLLERFWERVKKTGSCWLWVGTCLPTGYGRLCVGGKRGRSVYAHRLSWEVANGRPPGEMEIAHRCDNPPCVNPAHLFLATRQMNAADMVAKKRNARGQSSGRSVLSEIQVRQIRSRVSGGESQRRVAREMGVDHSTVCLIVRGRTWKHLPQGEEQAS